MVIELVVVVVVLEIMVFALPLLLTPALVPRAGSDVVKSDSLALPFVVATTLALSVLPLSCCPPSVLLPLTIVSTTVVSTVLVIVVAAALFISLSKSLVILSRVLLLMSSLFVDLLATNSGGISLALVLFRWAGDVASTAVASFTKLGLLVRTDPAGPTGEPGIDVEAADADAAAAAADVSGVGETLSSLGSCVEEVLGDGANNFYKYLLWFLLVFFNCGGVGDGGWCLWCLFFRFEFNLISSDDFMQR